MTIRKTIANPAHGKRQVLLWALLGGLALLVTATPTFAGHDKPKRKPVPQCTTQVSQISFQTGFGGFLNGFVRGHIRPQPSCAQIEYDRGLQEGRRAGRRAGIADGQYGRPFCGQPPALPSCSPHYRQGYLNGYARGYSRGFEIGSFRRRPQCVSYGWRY